MLMATHDLRLAATVATDVVFPHGGEVVEAGPARQVFGAPAAERTKRFVFALAAPTTQLPVV